MRGVNFTHPLLVQTMSNKIKSALIMEGGAMRGMFTSGVIDVLMEEGINFDGAAGISAGAVFGCNYKSKQIGRSVRYNIMLCKDPRYCSVRSLLKTGDLYNADFCYHTIPEEIDPFDTETFKNDPMEFYVGATNAETGETVYHKCTDGGEKDLQWFRASASMPLVSNIVEVDGYKLLDGGIVTPVPYKYMENLGYNKSVIILTQPKGYVKKKMHFSPLIKLAMRKYPKIAEAMLIRHERYNKQIKEIEAREAHGKVFVFRPPDPLNISRTEDDPKELRRVYNLGRAEAKNRLNELKKYLSNC